jgi:hypothetical protein
MKKIDIDFQGWPVHALTLKEVLLQLGLSESADGKTLQISVDNNILNAYPVLLEDDGMGYGVHPQYITEISTNQYKSTELDDYVFNWFINTINNVNSIDNID